MVSVIIVSDFERGVPKSVSWISDMATFLLFRSLQARRHRPGIFPEMLQRAHDRVGGEAAQRAERAELHGVAEVFSHRYIVRDAVAGADLVDGLDAAGRTDPAGCALAAGLDGAKLHREARLLRHVNAVVEHHDAAMTDQAIARREGLIVEWRVEQFPRKIRTERAADLHRAHGAAGKSSAADIIDQLAKRDTKSNYEQAATFVIARRLDRHRAARAAHAEIGIGFGATGEDEGDCR